MLCKHGVRGSSPLRSTIISSISLTEAADPRERRGLPEDLLRNVVVATSIGEQPFASNKPRCIQSARKSISLVRSNSQPGGAARRGSKRGG